jgi:hypothetical protein
VKSMFPFVSVFLCASHCIVTTIGDHPIFPSVTGYVPKFGDNPINFKSLYYILWVCIVELLTDDSIGLNYNHSSPRLRTLATTAKLTTVALAASSMPKALTA